MLGWNAAAGMLLVIACKSLNAIGNLQTAVTTLSRTDAEGWRSTLLKKVEWIEDATGRGVDFSLIVVEGIAYFMSHDDEPPVVLDSHAVLALFEAMFDADGGLLDVG